jgi:hypothetical protein
MVRLFHIPSSQVFAEPLLTSWSYVLPLLCILFYKINVENTEIEKASAETKVNPRGGITLAVLGTLSRSLFHVNHTCPTSFRAEQAHPLPSWDLLCP